MDSPLQSADAILPEAPCGDLLNVQRVRRERFELPGRRDVACGDLDQALLRERLELPTERVPDGVSDPGRRDRLIQERLGRDRRDGPHQTRGEHAPGDLGAEVAALLMEESERQARIDRRVPDPRCRLDRQDRNRASQGGPHLGLVRRGSNPAGVNHRDRHAVGRLELRDLALLRYGRRRLGAHEEQAPALLEQIVCPEISRELHVPRLGAPRVKLHRHPARGQLDPGVDAVVPRSVGEHDRLAVKHAKPGHRHILEGGRRQDVLDELYPVFHQHGQPPAVEALRIGPDPIPRPRPQQPQRAQRAG